MHLAAPRSRLGGAVFREFFEADPNAVLLVDPAGRIAVANRRAQELFGYSRDDLERLTIEDLVPARFREVHVEQRAGYEASPELRPMGHTLDLVALRQDGTEFPIDVALSTFGDGEDRLTCAIAVDVTVQRKSLRRQTALLNLTSQLSAALATDDVASVVLEGAVSGLSAAGAALVLKTPPESRSAGTDRYRRAVGVFPASADDVLERAMTRRELVFERRVERDGGAEARKRPPAIVALPLAVGDHVLGSLGIMTGEQSHADELPFLELLSRASAQALDRARAYDAERAARAAEQAAREQAQALVRLNAAVAEARTSTEVARLLLDEVFVAQPSARAAIMLLDEQGAEFELVGIRSSGSTVETRERWAFDRPSPARDVVLSGRLLIVDEGEFRARYPEVATIVGIAGMQSYVALPLTVSGRPVGVVGLTFDRAPLLEPEDLTHLQALVDGGAQAIARARFEEAGRRGQQLLAGVIAQMPLGVLVLEAGTMRVLYANDALSAMFGTDGGAVPGNGTRVLRVDGHPAPPRERPLTRAIEAGDTVTDELLVLAHPDGKRVSVSVNAGPIRDEAGNIVAGIGVYADVTARREAEAGRDAFIGVLSHELRTPITSIYAGANILAHRRPNPELAADVANDVAAEAERLHRLVEDLLVLSRVERGADMERDDPVLLQHVLPRVVAHEEARWPGTRFTVSFERGIPAVSGDESYVEQILRNLLSNAAKYGPAGAEIETVVEREGDEVTTRVLDRGPGIAPGEEEAVFGLFYRSAGASSAAPGAGIGLYAAQALAQAMDGRIWARRRLTGGTEVGFALRVLSEDMDDPAKARAVESAKYERPPDRSRG